MIFSDDFLGPARTHLGCPHLQIYLSKEWGSHNPQHRDLIRSELASVFSNKSLFTSISHCPSMGMVVSAQTPIGVDIEITSRVERKIVSRISRTREIIEAPSDASLWCAKEAAFKALRTYDQPPVVSTISIGGWQKNDSRTETFVITNPFDFKAPSNQNGVIFHTGNLTVGIFIFHT